LATFVIRFVSCPEAASAEKNAAAKAAKIGKNARIGKVFQKQSDK
jgi:hypothetical protein